MKRYLSVIAVVIALGALNACVALPTHDILFVGGTASKGVEIIVTVNVTFTEGTTNDKTDYPHRWVTKVDFEHHQIAQQGTVLHSSIRVTPTIKGQQVSCGILIDGKPILASTNSAIYPKDAVCIGPPV